MRGLLRQLTILLSILSLIALFANSAFAASSSQPEGPETFDVTESGRRLNQTEQPISAEAGNVSALNVVDQRVTESWQAYYGNISGTITLDDANNVTFYDWSLPNPTGEIYASNGTNVVWSKIFCMNVSGRRNNTGTEGSAVSSGSANNAYSINGSQIELRFGINASSADGLNETFNATYTDATGFTVGAVTIDSTDGCSLAELYTDQVNDAEWKELLLTDNASLVFTAIIRVDGDSYKNDGAVTETADFQMLVLENGHSGSETSTTTYYFYVELS